MSGYRVFFFDNGSSRKRWQIAQSGNTLITQTGTLKSALKETKKTLKSPSEAKLAKEKLVAAKIQEGFVEVQPDRLEIKRSRSRKGASEKDIKTLEKELGFQLPGEYRSFLKSTNGGKPNPDCVKVPGAKGIDNVGVGTFFHLLPSKKTHDEVSYELTSIGLPKGHLPIAQSSDVFSISLLPKTYGQIFWWNHDDGDDRENFVQSDAYLLASSFDEFLTRIATLNDEGIATSESNTISDSKSAKQSSKNTSTKPGAAAGLKGFLSFFKNDSNHSKIKEVKALLKDLDLSEIPDGRWPFKNIRNAEFLDCLLKAGLSPEIVDTDNHTLLWQCAGNAQCIKLLLAKGVDLERTGSENDTALIRALYLQDVPSVKCLLDAGANPTVKLHLLISDRLKSNRELWGILEKARAQWRKK